MVFFECLYDSVFLIIEIGHFVSNYSVFVPREEGEGTLGVLRQEACGHT